MVQMGTMPKWTTIQSADRNDACVALFLDSRVHGAGNPGVGPLLEAKTGVLRHTHARPRHNVGAIPHQRTRTRDRNRDRLVIHLVLDGGPLLLLGPTSLRRDFDCGVGSDVLGVMRLVGRPPPVAR